MVARSSRLHDLAVLAVCAPGLMLTTAALVALDLAATVRELRSLVRASDLPLLGVCISKALGKGRTVSEFVETRSMTDSEREKFSRPVLFGRTTGNGEPKAH